MDTPPARHRPPLPDPLPVPAEDLSLRAVGREFVDLYRFMFRELRWASGQVRKELAVLYRAARNPETSRETMKSIFRGLLRVNILNGAVLVVVMPLAGADEAVWKFMLTATIVCLVIEVVIAGSWFPPKKTSVAEDPPTVVSEPVPHSREEKP